MTTAILSRTELAGLVADLAVDGTRVIAPVPAGRLLEQTEYQPIQRLDEADLGGAQPRRSLKEFLRPAPGERSAPPQVILGARPCDAAGVDHLDALMGWDYRDARWVARRGATTIVSLACPGEDGSCFCSAVGLGPDSARGADALLVPLDGPSGPPAETRIAELMGRYVDVYLQDCEPFFGAAALQAAAARTPAHEAERYLAHAVTAKGKALLDGRGAPPASRDDLARAERFSRAARERVARNVAALPLRDGCPLDPELEARLGIAAADGGELVAPAALPVARAAPGLERLPAWLATNFDHPFWRPLAARCRGCGTCSAVCSSSPCFDLAEEAERQGAPCGPRFARRSQPERLRQRVMHKFSVSPRRFGAFLCTGCGRCTRTCQAGMNLPEILGQLVQLAGADQEGDAR